MKNQFLILSAATLIFLAACTKKETIVQQYNPPGASLYGTWQLVNTTVGDSSKRYIIFPNDGSNYFYQMTEDKFGLRTNSAGGVFNATDKQVIISSGGMFNYTVSHDSLILNQSPNAKIVALRIVAPTFTHSNFITLLSPVKSVQAMAGIGNLTYGFGFNGDSMLFYSNPYGTIRGYKFDLTSRTVSDSWTFGVPASMFYNAGYIYHGYNSNFRLAKRENKVGGAFVFASSNKMTDIRNISMNTSTNFIYAFQADYKMFTGIDAGAFNQFYDFTPYAPSNVVYYNSDAFLMYKSGYIYKVKIAPKFQVIESYQLRVMDEIEKIEILNQIIRSIPADSPIKNYMDDPGMLRKQLITVFNLMQDEGYTVETIGEWVKKVSDPGFFIESFPDLVYKRKGKNGEQPGDIKKSDYETLTSGWTKLENAAAFFELYREKKKEAGVYEFRDMIEWVNTAFKNDVDLLLHYQEQFQYILVDEYQDTSGLQNQILLSLISFWDQNPNCFVVGDDDQSIYAFQGARVDNMLGFADRYKNQLQTVVLTDNYRSTQTILDSARQLILNNVDRLENRIPDLTKKLLSAGENNIENAPAVDIKAYRNRFHEAGAIALEIKEKNRQEGLAWNDFAVIYPKHKLAQDLIDVFREENIPFVLSKEVDILQESLIRELLQWLQYLAEEMEMAHKGEHLLYPILHSPLYNISPFEVARISGDIYKQSKSDNPKYWREYLADILSKPTQADLFQVPPSGALKLLWNEVEKWLKEVSMLNVPQLVEKIIASGGFLTYAMKSDEKEWSMEVLRTFLDYAVACNEKVPFITLAAFLENTGTMFSNNIALPLVKIFGTDSGVILSSAHGSKGLEFENVYIIGVDQSNWEKDNSSGLPFHTSKLFGALSLRLENRSSKEENFEERRRLFYVAMTRAKKSLSISYCNQKADAGAKTLIPSQFIAEITGGAEIKETLVENALLAEIQLKILQATEKPVLKVENTDWLRKKTENFKFSPSTLYTLFECGLKFYFQRIVRVPSAPNAAAGYGSAIHNTLHRFVNMGTQKEKSRWLSSAELVTVFDQEMYKLRSNFNEVTYKTRLQQGKDLLPDYYAARIEDFKQHNAVITERWLETTIHGATVGGYIDKMVFNGNEVTIVDYKSGNPKNAELYFKPPSEKSIAEEKLPPKYWFQVGIYYLVVNGQNTKNWHAAMGLIDLLDKNEAGEFKQLKQTYDHEQLELLSNYVKQGKEKLDNLDFLEGCGKCEWCEFAKQTGQVVVVPGDGEEE